MRVNSRAGFALLPIVLAACAADIGGSRVTTEKLPGGGTRVTNPANGRWREGEAWKLRKILTIGKAESDAADVFGGIADIEVGADGRVYVLDRQSNDLRIFDREGRHMRTAGRAGDGPGEYQNAFGLEWLPSGDSLLIADPGLRRYTVVDRDGNFVRSMPRPLTSFGWVFLGGFANDRLYEHGSWRTQTESASGLVGMKFGATAELADTVQLPSTKAQPIPPFIWESERSRMFVGVPFAPSSTWFLTRKGDIWWGFAGEYRLFHVNSTGDTLMEVLVNGVAPQPVTSAEIQNWSESELPRTFRERGGKIDLSRIPNHKPFFTDLFADDDGNLWVDVPSADGLTTFDIFDKQGRRLGQVHTGVKRDIYIEPRLKNNRLYLAGKGDLDVPSVFVFAIER